MCHAMVTGRDSLFMDESGFLTVGGRWMYNRMFPHFLLKDDDERPAIACGRVIVTLWL